MTEILPVVMDTNFVRLGVIDDYSSFIWTTRYYRVGDFEICVDANAANVALLQKDYYIVRDDDEHVGIIEKIKIERNADGQEIVIASGRFLSSILGRRIIAVQTNVDTTVSAAINQLITENVISPAIADRRISNFTLGTYTITDAIEAQWTGKNLLETISEICETYNVGFKTTLSEGVFTFYLYKGVDHTYDQSTLPYIIFSDKYDNLLSSEYEENYMSMITAVLVAGEGEGLDRKTVWVNEDPTGIERYEAYKDHRDIRSNNGDISNTKYMKLLREAGKEELTEYNTAFSGTVYFGNINYRDDINVGDLCVIENTRWGIRMNVRLVEIIESVSETGEYSIIPTFATDSAPSIVDDSLYLASETNNVLLTETNRKILAEQSLSSSGDNSIRISELSELTSPTDTMYVPFANSQVATYKVPYGYIKNTSITNSEIDEIFAT